MTPFRTLLAAAFTLLAAPLLAHDYMLGDLAIGHPYSRATLPNQPAAGGFLSIANGGTEDDRLIAVRTAAAASAQIHEMRMEGDIMQMAELPDGLPIPAGETVVLAPGGFHLMLLDIAQPFVEGERVPVTLVFEKAGEIEVELAVGPRDAGAQDGGMDHSAMGGDDHGAHDNAGHDHGASHGAATETQGD